MKYINYCIFILCLILSLHVNASNNYNEEEEDDDENIVNNVPSNNEYDDFDSLIKNESDAKFIFDNCNLHFVNNKKIVFSTDFECDNSIKYTNLDKKKDIKDNLLNKYCEEKNGKIITKNSSKNKTKYYCQKEDGKKFKNFDFFIHSQIENLNQTDILTKASAFCLNNNGEIIQKKGKDGNYYSICKSDNGKIYEEWKYFINNNPDYRNELNYPIKVYKTFKELIKDIPRTKHVTNGCNSGFVVNSKLPMTTDNICDKKLAWQVLDKKPTLEIMGNINDIYDFCEKYDGEINFNLDNDTIYYPVCKIDNIDIIPEIIKFKDIYSSSQKYNDFDNLIQSNPNAKIITDSCNIFGINDSKIVFSSNYYCDGISGFNKTKALWSILDITSDFTQAQLEKANKTIESYKVKIEDLPEESKLKLKEKIENNINKLSQSNYEKTKLNIYILETLLIELKK